MATSPGTVRVGIGGWDYEPWRRTFYPAGVAKAHQLEYASRQVTAIEINGTFYRLQTPAVYARWHDQTPDSFVFSVKAPRFIVQRRDLTTAGTALQRFLSSGITELKAKLGPILWQLADTKTFDAEELSGFLALLPPTAGRVPLRHALEVRHASFLNREFLEIARRHAVAVVFEDDAVHAGIADLTSTFVYARLRRCVASCPTGYPLPQLRNWALRSRTWALGREPTGLPRIEPPARSGEAARDVFIFFINGAKERAPAAAGKLLALLDSGAAKR